MSSVYLTDYAYVDKKTKQTYVLSCNIFKRNNKRFENVCNKWCSASSSKSCPIVDDQNLTNERRNWL